VEIENKSGASAQGTPRVSAGNFQMRRAQSRAKIGAAQAVTEVKKTEENEKVSVTAGIKIICAGTADKICCETAGAVDSIGVDEGAAGWQQSVCASQARQGDGPHFVPPAHGEAACAQTKISAQKMVSAIFTTGFIAEVENWRSTDFVFPSSFFAEVASASIAGTKSRRGLRLTPARGEECGASLR
jgi:hypothetical protein